MAENHLTLPPKEVILLVVSRESVMNSENRITKDTTLSEAMQRFPSTEAVFIQYGLHCVGCAVATLETVEDAAAAHGKDLGRLLEDLNRAAGQTG
ncbi:MAG: DUF1858 domain-containing protein [Candidatus Zixiibacteriota bacterium]|nr:MAG: DUF1858 domain-containing protein [candidate division Zixibacteria bacterium]